MAFTDADHGSGTEDESLVVELQDGDTGSAVEEEIIQKINPGPFKSMAEVEPKPLVD